MKPGLRATAAPAGVGCAQLPVRLWLACAAVWLASLLPAAAARAADVVQCPQDIFTLAAPESPVALRGELGRLALLAPVCDARDDFHARRGALLLSDGQYNEAASALEKALLLNPDLAGAQLDYAQALARGGQREVALDLVKQVAQRPDIEPELRAWLEQEARRAAQPGAGVRAGASDAGAGPRASGFFSEQPASRLSWSAMLQSSFGRESNLVSASHTRELTLYLLGGPVVVPLADNQQPQAGLALRLSGGVQAAINPGFGELRLGAFLQKRIAEAGGVPEQQFSRLEVGFRHPLGPGHLNWTAARQSLRQGDLYGADDLTYLADYTPTLRLGPCLAAGALGQADQRYAQAANMAGRYRFGRLELRCAIAGEWRIGQTAGTDTAELADRPGGDKKRADLYLRYDRPLQIALPGARPASGFAGRLNVWVRSSSARDERVYSELLGADPTRTRRQDFGAGIWWQLGRRWQAGVDVEKNSQTSTNPLLSIENLLVYTGLRWQME